MRSIARSWWVILLIFLFPNCNSFDRFSDNRQNPQKIPPYWKEYFDLREDKLKNAASLVANNGVSFAFITDIHVKSNNMYSPSILKYLTDNGLINKIVCGGDIITESHSDKHDAIKELTEWADSMAPLCIPILLGNHDLNTNNQKDLSQALSKQLFYNLHCIPISTQVLFSQGNLYGYEDDLTNQVRYLYLDTGAPDNAVIEETQITWLKDRIKELEEGWTVVLFCHQFWIGNNSNEAELKIDENGIAIEKALDDVLTVAQATMACVISGHCHRNYSKKSQKGYPIIATTCDAGSYNSELYDPDTPYRIPGTTSEQAFDIFYINTQLKQINVIRIGAGDSIMDRCFFY